MQVHGYGLPVRLTLEERGGGEWSRTQKFVHQKWPDFGVVGGGLGGGGPPSMVVGRPNVRLSPVPHCTPYPWTDHTCGTEVMVLQGLGSGAEHMLQNKPNLPLKRQYEAILFMCTTQEPLSCLHSD